MVRFISSPPYLDYRFTYYIDKPNFWRINVGDLPGKSRC